MTSWRHDEECRCLHVSDLEHVACCDRYYLRLWREGKVRTAVGVSNATETGEESDQAS